jgi:hypothetical protein
MIARGGVFTAPHCAGAFVFYPRHCGTRNVRPIDAHSDYAVFKHDVAISMAWGATAGGDYKELWATRCPDPRARTAYVDIFYTAPLVFATSLSPSMATTATCRYRATSKICASRPNTHS